MLKDNNIIKKKDVDLHTLCANECFMKGYYEPPITMHEMRLST